MEQASDAAEVGATVVIAATVIALVVSVFLSGIATLAGKQTAVNGVIRVVLSTLFVFCLSFGWLVINLASNKP